MTAEFVEIGWAGRRVVIEHEWMGAGAAGGGSPLVVFLHEGLGSVAMWRDFPERLCRAVGARGLVYSRPGYGRSTPRSPGERWSPDFMHRQAHEVLPALLRALGIGAGGSQPAAPLWLLGHSDGGSIALLHAARPEVQATPLAGIVVMAPHILVEDVSIESIAKAREAYATTDLRARLAKYHDDPDSAFRGWNDAWLDPAFRAWNVEAELEGIGCPVLAMQGLADEYGTLEQIRGIARRVPGTRLIEIPECGHSPHRDQPATVVDAVKAFMQEQGRRVAGAAEAPRTG